MPGIAIGNCIPFNRGGVDWSTYWTTRYPSALVAEVVSDTEIDLSWTNNGTADYTGHKVYISTDNSTFTLKDTIASIGTTHSITGLTANTLYYIKIAAYKSDSISAYSNLQVDATPPAALFDTNHVDLDYEKDVTIDGSNLVSSWKDNIGGVIEIVQADDVKKPVKNTSGIYSIGNAKVLDGAWTLEQPTFIYAVIKQVRWISTQYIWDGHTKNGGALLQYDASPEIDAYAGSHSAQTLGLALNEWGIVRVLYKGATSKLQVNGNAAWTGDLGSANMDGFKFPGLGASSANVEAKRFIISKIDDAANEAGLYSYLVKKYFNTMLVADGDSLTEGVASGATDGMTYPKQLEDLFKLNDNRNILIKHSYAVAGQTLTQMEADAAAQIDPMLADNCKMLLIWGGVNDFGLEPATSKETVFTRLQTYVTARKAAGWNTVVLTMLPQSYYARAGFDAERLWFNTQIKTALTGVDIIADVAADGRIGDSGDELDATYFNADKIHLNNTGYGIVAEVVYNAIKSTVLV